MTSIHLNRICKITEKPSSSLNTKRLFVSLILLLASLIVSWLGSLCFAGEIKPNKAYDFYLTRNRICKKCYWKRRPDGRVELTNQQGVGGVYTYSEFLGVDKNPVLRKLFRKSVHGVGLPGRIIVPTAYDDEPHLDHP